MLITLQSLTEALRNAGEHNAFLQNIRVRTERRRAWCRRLVPPPPPLLLLLLLLLLFRLFNWLHCTTDSRCGSAASCVCVSVCVRV